jgi:hypothetical protein
MINNQYKELFNITLVIKNDPNDEDGFDSGTYTVDFKNSFMTINGNSMVIETKNEDNVIGKVFNLKSVESYKIWQ